LFVANFCVFLGLRVERYMECPHCSQPSFTGEWTAPKDLQESSDLSCSSCEKEVKRELLIQPKERKAGELIFYICL